MIQHLSYQDSQSINDFIEQKHCTSKYLNINQAADLILKLGKGALLSKTDIKSAFRLLRFVGINFGNQYLYDKMLPMGSSAGCANLQVSYIGRQVRKLKPALSRRFPIWGKSFEF